MTKQEFSKLLEDFKNGKITEEKLTKVMLMFNPESMGFATIDHHRKLRKGFPEVILSQGKTPQQVADIAVKIIERGEPLLATRASEEHFKAVKKKIGKAIYDKVSRTIIANKPKEPVKGKKTILIISAGTIDIPVAEEACITAEMLGNPIDRLYDVGVAGIHRLFSNYDKIMSANVIIVVAGMEGALPSVVGGLVDVPVIAVPTSGGYGASFGGVAALLGMLNTCASGVTVVNIDNGFGAGFAASIMNR
ncbi:MAG: nickel pincer cofactor biosynthesis protein LarB [Bacteroidota bacterium]|nr:nickel pincer cofactor biosynthesis protein LarB [Bacteroidota bacterium]